MYSRLDNLNKEKNKIEEKKLELNNQKVDSIPYEIEPPFFPNSNYRLPLQLLTQKHLLQLQKTPGHQKLLVNAQTYSSLTPSAQTVFRLATSAYEFVNRTATYGSFNKLFDLLKTDSYSEKLSIEAKENEKFFQIVIIKELPKIGHFSVSTSFVTSAGLFKTSIDDQQNLFYKCLLTPDQLKKINFYSFFPNAEEKIKTNIPLCITHEINAENLNLLNQEIKMQNLDSRITLYASLKETSWENIKRLASNVLVYRSGTCGEKAPLALLYLYSQRSQSIRNLTLHSVDGDHMFLSINLDGQSLNSKTIPEDAFVLDVWSDELYLAKDYEAHQIEIRDYCQTNHCEKKNYLSIKFRHQYNFDAHSEYDGDNSETICDFIAYHLSASYPLSQCLFDSNSTEIQAFQNTVKKPAQFLQEIHEANGKPTKNLTPLSFFTTNNTSSTGSISCENDLMYEFFISKVRPEFYYHFFTNHQVATLTGLSCYKDLPKIYHNLDADVLIKRFKLEYEGDSYRRYFTYVSLFNHQSNKIGYCDFFYGLQTLLTDLVHMARIDVQNTVHLNSFNKK